MQEEQQFLNEGGIVVTSARVEIDGRTYATRNIGSVGVRVPGVSWLACVVVLMGVICLAGGTYGTGILLLAVGGFWVYSSRQRRRLVLMAGGGEVLALQSRNPPQMEKIRAAIASAIAVR
ncbi:DUF6232 family protein [Pseudacidovorax intermedius]|uniref:DUF6232 family protein n=1 Tax=Pseudacidovorax intermedius TaxID=433924 RepID=UPI0026F2A661|nr:DUF6232 family protein [Pseudacidovorax intermedius]